MHTNTTTTADARKWRYAKRLNAIIKWETPGQTEEGTFCGGKIAGKNSSMLYTFRRNDGTIWKTFGSVILDELVGQFEEDDYLKVIFLGRDPKDDPEGVKLFDVAKLDGDAA